MCAGAPKAFAPRERPLRGAVGAPGFVPELTIVGIEKRGTPEVREVLRIRSDRNGVGFDVFDQAGNAGNDAGTREAQVDSEKNRAHALAAPFCRIHFRPCIRRALGGGFYRAADKNPASV